MPRNRSRINLRPLRTHWSLRLSLPPTHYHLWRTHEFLAEIEDGGWLVRSKATRLLSEIYPAINGYAQSPVPQAKAEAALATLEASSVEGAAAS